ncbi:alginate lyase [candidate division KSB1 bacterium]|nr:alginate lyase [candidate division KSB1 bacterium]
MKFFSRLIMLILSLILFAGCQQADKSNEEVLHIKVDIAAIDSSRIFTSADQYLEKEPVTVTASTCERSLGGKHDFYSEGDYWWPNPDDPDGPYIRKDGMTNPENFKDHRRAMRRMSIQVAALAAAFKISGEQKYADHAVNHLKAWFVDEETKMNPNMNYAQAIKGICPGRGVGLIDGIHFVEPARAVMVLEKLGGISGDDAAAIKSWFNEFVTWMTTHEYGIDERDRKNNHGTCWVMQVAQFADLTGNEELMDYCRNRYKTVILPNQMSPDGSFHMELKRTKPYGYSLFNIDAHAIACHILSTPEDNLWTFELEDGRGIRKGMEYIYPYIKDKSTWPLEPDVMYWDEWPVRHPCLLFAGSALDKPKYIELWKQLDPLPDTEEGMRNFPLREPVLWM